MMTRLLGVRKEWVREINSTRGTYSVRSLAVNEVEIDSWSEVKQSMSESVQLNMALCVLMYRGNKFKGLGGLLSEDDFMPYVLLTYYHNSVQNGMFLVPSSKQHRKMIFSWPCIFQLLFMELTLLASYPHLIFLLSNVNLCVRCLRFEMNNSSMAMTFKLKIAVYC